MHLGGGSVAWFSGVYVDFEWGGKMTYIHYIYTYICSGQDDEAPQKVEEQICVCVYVFVCMCVWRKRKGRDDDDVGLRGRHSSFSLDS